MTAQLLNNLNQMRCIDITTAVYHDHRAFLRLHNAGEVLPDIRTR